MWTNAISDIIEFSQEGSQIACFAGLNILKSISASVKAQSGKHVNWLMLKVHEVFAFATQILQSFPNNLQEDVYLECLSMTKTWCRFHRKSFIISDQFIQCIFNLLAQQTSESIYKKTINLMKKLLIVSNYSKMLTLQDYKKAIENSAIPQKDLKFLHHLVSCLYQER